MQYAAAPLAAAVLLSGCGLFAEEFEPDGVEAVAAREAAFARIDAAMPDAVGDGSTLGRARFDLCSQGQNNWKRRDEHAWECVAASSEVVVTATNRPEVAAALTVAQARADDLGCTPNFARGAIGAIEEEYWAPRAQDPTYSAGDLPSATYTCADGLRLEMRPTAAGSDPQVQLDVGVTLASSPDPRVLTSEPFDDDVVAAAQESPAALLLVVTVSRMYYDVDF